MSEARDRILAAVRLGLGRKGPLPAAQVGAERSYIAEHRRGPLPRGSWDLVQRFRERVLALASSVDRVQSMAAVPAAVGRYLAEHSLPAKVVVWQEMASLDWGGAGITAEARRAEGDDLVGVTGSFCAIAETGTLLLLSGPFTPPSTSLLPETHVAVVACDRIVATMEDAWALARAELGELPRAANFVSGPSRTADIEQTLVLGAHGPYRVHIVFVDMP